MDPHLFSDLWAMVAVTQGLPYALLSVTVIVLIVREVARRRLDREMFGDDRP